MGIEVFEKIKKLLDEHHVNYQVLEHEHVVTSADAAKIRGTKLEEAAKALVLQSKEGAFVQFVIPAARRLHLKKVKKLLEVKNIALASPDDVLKKTDCTVGSVPPFGILFNIPVYLDRSILELDMLVFSAGTHNHSIKIKPKDYVLVVKPEVVDVLKTE